MQFRIYKYENGGGGGELHNAYEAATAAEAFIRYPDHVEQQGSEHLLCADAVDDDD